MAEPISKEQQKQLAEDHEKATILKDSLKIVNKLAKMDVDNIFAEDDQREELEDLIDEAKKLSKHRLWKL
jgi:predicted lipoprotein